MFEGADFMRLGVGTSVLCYAHVNGMNFLTICGSVRVSRLYLFYKLDIVYTVQHYDNIVLT